MKLIRSNPSNCSDVESQLDQALTAVLDGQPGVISKTAIRRRRIFASITIIVAGVAGMIVALPIKNRQPIDIALWMLFFVVLLGVGVWNRRLASVELREAQKIRSKITPKIHRVK